MKKRVFLAINLPNGIKNKIETEIEKIKPFFDSGARFLQRENWHLTLSFLGYQDDQSINLILRAMQTIVPSYSTPEIKFEKIIYGPPNKTPRMLWISCAKETSQNLNKLKNDIENSLIESGVRFRIEKRSYSAHLTLARFSETSQKSLPNIERNFSLGFKVGSLDLMESILKRSGAEYQILSKVDFKDNLE